MIAIFQRTLGDDSVAFAGEIQADQRLAAKGENHAAQEGQKQADNYLEAEGVAHAVGVLGAVKLGGEDTRAGDCTEDAQVEHQNQTVGDGDTAHGHGAHLADHDVVQHGDEIGNAVLDNNGHGDPQNMAVKRPVADVAV